LVFPSVEIPSFFAVSIRTSVSGAAGGEVGLVASLYALSISFRANPIDLANSGSFCGPHTNSTTMIANTMSHSYPTIANLFARVSCNQLALKGLSISFQVLNGDMDRPQFRIASG